jgi:hypothetical protein
MPPQAKRAAQSAAQGVSRRTIFIGLVIGVVLVFVGGYYLINNQVLDSDGLSLPTEVGEYTRDVAQRPTPNLSADAKAETISATYTRDRVSQFIVVAARPIDQPEQMLTDASATNITKVSRGACGYLSTYNSPVCAISRGATGIMIVGLRDQPTDGLMKIAGDVASAMD